MPRIYIASSILTDLILKSNHRRTRRRKALTGPSSESFNSSSSNSIQSSNLKINIVPSKTTKSISNLRSCELKTKIEVKLVPVHKVYGPKISVEIFFLVRQHINTNQTAYKLIQ